MSDPARLPAILADTGANNSVLITFLIYLVLVFVLAALSKKHVKSKSFLSEYFLGSRALGMWAFALTFAATSSSGGSFMGFPSKIYSHGWVLGLWIGSYLVVPICAMGLLGKRINHVARISGAITIPDVLRDRFRSMGIGLFAVCLIVFFMTFNLVAQFKGGSVILKTLLADVGLFTAAADALPSWLTGLSAQGSEYVLCLLVFGIAVIAYTTYGGFRAVVWTDVMQGIVMVVGVVIMLPLAVYQAGSAAPQGVGRLEHVTQQMGKMLPPRFGTATVHWPAEVGSYSIAAGTWVEVGDDDADSALPPRLLRIVKRVTVNDDTEGMIRGVEVLEIVTVGDIDRITANPVQLRRFDKRLVLTDIDVKDYDYGAAPGEQGAYVTGPGPKREGMDGFLPLSLAFSFFFMWAIAGAGQPSSMVRLMAFRNSLTLRRSIITVAVYYSMIYFPLVIIFCCGRVLLPGMDGESDRIMPQLSIELTRNIGMGWLAGLLIAAPFAAVMSTVDSFLLMISSSLVRDIYQRDINPNASEKQIRRLCYLCTLLVGVGALLGSLNPPEYLQDIIVYTGGGLAACFLGSMVYALYWPRANLAGCAAAMASGFLSHLCLYLVGFLTKGRFEAYQLAGIDPIIIGLVTSFVVGFIVTLLTNPPPRDLVRTYFYAEPHNRADR